MQHLSPKPARRLTSREVAKIIEAFCASLIPMCENGAATMRSVFDYLGESEYTAARYEIWKMMETAAGLQAQDMTWQD